MLKYKIPQIVTLTHKKELLNNGCTNLKTNINANIIKKSEKNEDFFVLLAFPSLLSDSNQRPRDYKSRALAN